MENSLEVAESPPEVVCPTCGARQPWSEECRRCKTGLEELRAVWQAGRRARRACLRALERHDFRCALLLARRHAFLDPGEDATRLLAVCHLLQENWAEAFALARREAAGKQGD